MAPDDRKARRNVIVLVIAQAVLGAQMPISFILGGLSGQLLSPEACFATLPISLIVLTTMFSAPVMSGLMQRYGRRAGFLLGAAAGAAGGAIAAAGLLAGSLPLFLLGSVGTGIYMSAQGFYRFAAADMASESFRPKAISWVMAGGLFSALIGPQLVKATTGLTDPVPFAGGYMAITALNLAGAAIFFFLAPSRVPQQRAAEAARARIRTRRQLLRDPNLVVPMICAMVSYALMNLVMTSTPLAVVGCGFETADAANVVAAHVLAMFAPSFFTGHLIARFGHRRIIAVGLGLLATAGLIGLAGNAMWNFYGTMILLGLGWNFGFIGATSMLAGAHSPEERGRVQGMNDFAVFGLVSVASLSSGILMNCSGGSPEQGWVAVNLAMLPLLVFAGSALLWFSFRDIQRRA